MSLHEPEKLRKLFIGGLSFDTTDENLKRHFEQYGTLVDCVVMKDGTTKKSRGFGFVTYETENMLDIAQNARPHLLDGKTVDTKRATPREEQGNVESQQSVKKMFIGGLPEGATEITIREVFSCFGNIQTVELFKNKATGKQRGFCFVSFDDYDPVDKCVLHKPFKIMGKPVDVKKAHPKTDDSSVVFARQNRQKSPEKRIQTEKLFVQPTFGDSGVYSQSVQYGVGLTQGYFQPYFDSYEFVGGYAASQSINNLNLGSQYTGYNGGGVIKANTYSNQRLMPYGLRGAIQY